MRLLESTALTLSLLGFGLAGCTGIVGDDDGTGGGPGVGPGGEQLPLACDTDIPQAGVERVQRLTPDQYTNSVRALLGNENFDPTVESDQEAVATLSAVRKWSDAADLAVPTDTGWMTTYASCDVATDEACAKDFYGAFAERAFRRPLLADEAEWLDEAWTALPADATLAERLAAMAEIVLQAPGFLYLYSEGTPVADSPHGLRSLTGHERAQRLSYFLWNSLPDAELTRAAADGELDSAAGMRAQAERMLADERSKPMLRAFLVDWLDLDGALLLPSLDVTPKDAEMFPELTPSLRAAMTREIEAFMEYVMFEKDGSLEALFTDTRAYVNGPLATLYGVEGGPTGEDEWAWVNLDAEKRAGMLTRAGFLTVHAAQTATSPIRRGVYMLREVLCFPLPPPPPDVDNTPVDVVDISGSGEVNSVRAATQQRTAGDACQGCHAGINSLGFAFEHYDAIGRWQDAEEASGATIDASSELVHAGAEFDGPVDGAVELSGRLAASPAVQACATERWFEVALRRSPVELDACAIEDIHARVQESGSIRELLLAIVESDAFLHVNHGVDAAEGGN